MSGIVITIDGPAASGKGKIAKYIANKWKFKHLDSGVLYRKIALRLIKKKIKHNSIKEIRGSLLNKKSVSFRKVKQLRNEDVGKYASKIAIYKFVRDYVNKLQREFVKNNSKFGGFVVDGRDIGSVVFKNANLKLYIEVNVTNRAKRRYKQLIDSGEKSIYPKILKELKLRDKTDIKRKISPLVIPKGAKIVDNNGTFQNTKKIINNFLRQIDI